MFKKMLLIMKLRDFWHENRENCYTDSKKIQYNHEVNSLFPGGIEIERR